MEYKRLGSKIIVRIDKDEEILEKVKELALKENIRLAVVQALGATNSFTVGVYNVAEKKYYANTFLLSFFFAALQISAPQAMQTAAAKSAMPSVSHSQDSSYRIFMRSSSPVR